MSQTAQRRWGSLVRSTLSSVRLSELTDGELLTRFSQSRDEPAFAELVRRIGPSVLGVCRRILGEPADADDAFQVVFMVLARKADTIRPPARVAAWLHGVAVLVSRKAKAKRDRRSARQRSFEPEADPPDPKANRAEIDLAQVLDQEIQRLPERYRLPVVLCEIRELTVAQAAAELGRPIGTVASLLSRGRAMLAERLRRRGVWCGAAVALTAAMTEMASARVPTSTLEQTMTAVTAGSVDKTAFSVDPPLLKEVLWTMAMSKLRTVGLGVAAAVAVVWCGSGVFRPAYAAPVTTGTATVSPKTADGTIDRLQITGLARLLTVEAVRSELELTDDQKKKIETVNAEQAKKWKGLLGQGGGGVVVAPGGAGLPPLPGGIQVRAGGIELTGSAGPETDKALAEVLTSTQLRRMKQIILQSKGPAALLDRRVIRFVGMTEEQEDKIENLLPAVPQGNVTVRTIVDGVERDPIAEKIDSAWTETIGVLTPDQKAKWDALAGKMLPTTELRKAQSAGFLPGNLGKGFPVPLPLQLPPKN